jgi:hypothetical protein
MNRDRRDVLRALGATGGMLTFGRIAAAAGGPAGRTYSRRFHFVHVDVFTSQPLRDNAMREK